MILLDVNVLVGAFRDDAPDHPRLHRWLEDALSDPRPVAAPAAAVVGFLRIVTHPSIFRPPTPLREAVGYLDALIGSGELVIAEAGDRHWPILSELIVSADARGNRIPDAHLAALTLEHGATIATRDRGFSRFPGVSWFDPIAAG